LSLDEDLEKDELDSLPSVFKQKLYLLNHVNPIIRAHHNLTESETMYRPKELKAAIAAAEEDKKLYLNYKLSHSSIASATCLASVS
jgi:hypothetical protein